MKKVSVIGAGSWGSALAVLLANNGHEVTLWTHDPHEIEMLSTKREQQEKLPGVKLPDNIAIEADLETALTDEDVVVMAVPSPVVRTVAKQMSSFVKDGQIIVNVAKGIEDVTYKTLSDIIEEEIPNAEVSVLSGPSHAEEVGIGIPTTFVIGAKNKKTAEMLQDVFMNKVFRVYTSSDIIGIELGGALKNVIALAAGTVTIPKASRGIAFLMFPPDTEERRRSNSLLTAFKKRKYNLLAFPLPKLMSIPE